MIPKIDNKTIKIGNEITAEIALKLCKHYGFGQLVTRITENQEAFKNWVFDGASMIPDDIFSRVFEIPSLTEISLRHDLKYAYGDPDNEEEKTKRIMNLNRSYLTMTHHQ